MKLNRARAKLLRSAEAAYERGLIQVSWYYIFLAVVDNNYEA